MFILKKKIELKWAGNNMRCIYEYETFACLHRFDILFLNIKLIILSVFIYIHLIDYSIYKYNV